MTRNVAVLVTGSATSERTATTLKLAERILARGHRVTVYAHDDAAALSTGDGDVARAVAQLVRRGVHGATLDWVVDSTALARHGSAAAQAPGVVPGDHADLWAFVRDADVVLAPGGMR